MRSHRRSRGRRTLVTTLAISLPLAIASPLTAGPVLAASAGSFAWTTVANSATPAPGSDKVFNSFNQPSVNTSGLVVFRARTKGPQEPVRGVYTRNPLVSGSSVVPVATVGSQVPQPNNLDATFNEFPSFPRIAKSGPQVATRGQSTPVWKYMLPDGTETRTGTSGVYAQVAGSLVTGASLLGAVPQFSVYQVPGAPTGTRFDQFPGAPAIAGNTIAFKGNYTQDGSARTGVYYRNLSSAKNPTRLVANSTTRIPNQPAGGTVTFGSTAPPSATNGRMVFLGLDNEESPTLGGIYLASITGPSSLRTLVGIGARVPGLTSADRFNALGEALSFDGRYVAFWGAWGSATRTITLQCATDGNADLLQYCNEHYPGGYPATVPVNQGIFVYDTSTSRTATVATTGSRFNDFLYWVFSGRPPGTGGGDEPTQEPPRWRASAFVAASTGASGYQAAFKGSPVAGGSGIYVAQAPSDRALRTVVDTSTAGTAIDPAAPVGSTVSTVGLERDGFRGRQLALSIGMLNPTTSESWAGAYLTKVPWNLGS